MFDVSSLARVGPVLDCRAVTFENPTGARGAGGPPAGGRKGAPNKLLTPGERVVLADLAGPRHDPPHLDDVPARATRGDAGDVPRGVLRRPRRAEHLGAVRRLLRRAARTAGGDVVGPHRDPGGARLQQLHPDARSASASASSSSTAQPNRTYLYYQIDYTMGARAGRRSPARHVPAREPDDAEARLRHRGRAARAGPLPRLQRRRPVHRPRHLVRRGRGQGVPRRRHRSADDLRHRPRGLRRHGVGDERPHLALRRRAPRRARARARRAPRSPTSSASTGGTCSTRSCSSAISRSTIQQIGYDVFFPGDEDAARQRRGRGPPGRPRASRRPKTLPLLAHGIVERIDDYCATSYTVCADAQPVPRLDLDVALADIGRLDYEVAEPDGVAGRRHRSRSSVATSAAWARRQGWRHPPAPSSARRALAAGRHRAGATRSA